LALNVMKTLKKIDNGNITDVYIYMQDTYILYYII